MNFFFNLKMKRMILSDLLTKKVRILLGKIFVKLFPGAISEIKLKVEEVIINSIINSTCLALF